MIDVLIQRLGSDQAVTNAVITALSCVVVLVTVLSFVAFFQGRSIEFWPPKIGERPPRVGESGRGDRLLVAACCFGSTLLLALLLATRSGLPQPQPLIAAGSRPYALSQVTVESSAGFQNSGIYLKAGEKVVLDPDGRINLASLQNNIFLDMAKAIVAYNLPETETHQRYRETYLPTDPEAPTASQVSYNDVNDLLALTGGKVFERAWIGVDGEKIDSRDLNPCLLFQGNAGQDGDWGMLLAQVMAEPGSAVSDPFEVLAVNGLAPTDLVPVVTANFVFEAKRDGWLTFIVNEAVLSSDGTADRQRCADYRQALRKASDNYKLQVGSFRLPDRSIPLTWYSDNLGAFHVVIKPFEAAPA
jgi:hypothetical protein